MTGPLKWHGGKTYLADWIISLMPPRCTTPNKPMPSDKGWLHYVEPYFGGGAVLLANDPEGISEVANDINSRLTTFWSVMQDQTLFDGFHRQCLMTPFSEDTWKRCHARLTNPDQKYNWPVQEAHDFYVHCRQSLSGRMKGFAGITRERTRRGMNEQVSAWLNCVEGLLEVHERLIRVLIRNKSALDIIKSEDGPRTLFYLDPPYLHETRATTGEYAHEMTADEHGELLELLGSTELQGRFLLSGYHSDLYDDWAKACGWTCHEKEIDNKAAGGKTKRKMIECVWTNF